MPPQATPGQSAAPRQQAQPSLAPASNYESVKPQPTRREPGIVPELTYAEAIPIAALQVLIYIGLGLVVTFIGEMSANAVVAPTFFRGPAATVRGFSLLISFPVHAAVLRQLLAIPFARACLVTLIEVGIAIIASVVLGPMIDAVIRIFY